MNNTPTPRTDEAQFGTGRVSVDFARRLERELAAVTEQRDRLAEALEEYREALHDGPENCSYKMYEAVDEFAEKALQSLNPDHTVDANDMIAAVKGGADE